MLIERDRREYEAHRRRVVWNSRLPDRYPDAIAVPANADGAADAVRDAARRGQKVAVRSGGHNWLGASLRDGGVLIDLGQLTQVDVDPKLGLARVGAGATHQMLADRIVEFGLAFPIGHCPSVGLGGYLLAGGMGWNLRSWGPGCWNVSAAEVVIADGTTLRIDSANDADLLWALRGGGYGFPGLVTGFELDLFALPQIVTRHITFGLSALPNLLSSIAEGLDASGPGLEISLIVRPTRRGPDPGARVIVATTAFAESQSAAEARLDECLQWMTLVAKPIEDSGSNVVELNQLEGEGGWSDAFRYAADTCWVDSGFEQLGGIIAEHILKAPSPDSRVVLAFGYLPDSDVDVAFTGFGSLTSNVYATWRDSSDDQPNINWLRGFMSALTRLSSGAYVGEADMTIHPLQEAYPEDKLAKLTRVIDEYDAHGVFHGFLDQSEVDSNWTSK